MVLIIKKKTISRFFEHNNAIKIPRVESGGSLFSKFWGTKALALLFIVNWVDKLDSIMKTLLIISSFTSRRWWPSQKTF